MHWIIQENVFNESEWPTMIRTLDRFDIPYSVHKVVPFIGELLPEPTVADDKVICFGSYAMRHAAKKNNWTPGVYDLFDQNFEVQREHWGDKLLNYDSDVMEFRYVNFEGARFIRPIDDSKYFAGALFNDDDFYEWQKRVCDLGLDDGSSLRPSTLVQVNAPKEIYQEVRLWIYRRRIIAASIYKIGSRVTYLPTSSVDFRYFEFAKQQVLYEMCGNYWEPADAYCLDLCDTPNGIKIVEINTINSCGFYAGDIQQIVLSLSG